MVSYLACDVGLTAVGERQVSFAGLPLVVMCCDIARHPIYGLASSGSIRERNRRPFNWAPLYPIPVAGSGNRCLLSFSGDTRSAPTIPNLRQNVWLRWLRRCVGLLRPKLYVEMVSAPFTMGGNLVGRRRCACDRRNGYGRNRCCRHDHCGRVTITTLAIDDCRCHVVLDVPHPDWVGEEAGGLWSGS